MTWQKVPRERVARPDEIARFYEVAPIFLDEPLRSEARRLQAEARRALLELYAIQAERVQIAVVHWMLYGESATGGFYCPYPGPCAWCEDYITVEIGRRTA